MADTVSEANDGAFRTIIEGMQSAWNAGDGAGFGAPMTEDADFVTIRGDHLRGREAIVASHTGIFATIYAGSRNHLTLESSRLLRDDVALIHVRSVLEAPSGPLAGRHGARFSAVLLREGARWRITSFHITLEPSAVV